MESGDVSTTQDVQRDCDVSCHPSPLPSSITSLIEIFKIVSNLMWTATEYTKPIHALWRNPSGKSPHDYIFTKRENEPNSLNCSVLCLCEAGIGNLQR